MKKLLKKNQIMITALAIMIAVAGYLNFAGTSLEQETLLTTQEAMAETGEDDTEVSALLDISDEDIDTAAISDITSLDSEVTYEVSDYLDEGMAENVAEEGTDSLAAAEGTEALEVAANDVVEDTAEGSPSVTETPGEAVFTSSTAVSSLSAAKLMKEQTRAKNKETLLTIINNGNIGDEQKQSAIDSMISLTDITEKETAAEVLLEAKGFSDVVVSINEGSVDVCVAAGELSDVQCAQIIDIVSRKTEISAENIVITPVGLN